MKCKSHPSKIADLFLNESFDTDLFKCICVYEKSFSRVNTSINQLNHRERKKFSLAWFKLYWEWEWPLWKSWIFCFQIKLFALLHQRLYLRDLGENTRYVWSYQYRVCSSFFLLLLQITYSFPDQWVLCVRQYISAPQFCYYLLSAECVNLPTNEKIDKLFSPFSNRREFSVSYIFCRIHSK